MSGKNCSNSAKIVEIFSSIQGEGLDVGELQLFIRFAGCNLNCKYCDTEHGVENSDDFSVQKLIDEIKDFNIQIISLTGGEPLMHADFLAEFLPETNKKIYLETNGTMCKNLKKVINFIDTISMDIKLKSATGEENKFDLNRQFIKIAKDKNLFIKIVFDENIEENEIEQVSNISKENSTPLILQPKMPMNKDFLPQKIFEKFYKKYKNVRLIPQVHKFLNIK